MEGLAVHNFTGKTTLSEMFLFVSQANALCCNDSMALHVGSAFKIPTVVVFCATAPEFGFGPWMNPNAVVVERTNLPCRPCRRHGSKQCPTGTELCIKTVTPLMVISALEKVLKKNITKHKA